LAAVLLPTYEGIPFAKVAAQIRLPILEVIKSVKAQDQMLNSMSVETTSAKVQEATELPGCGILMMI